MKSWIFQLLRPFKTSLAKILVIQLCMAVIIAIQPIYMQQLVGVMLEGNLQGDFPEVINLALILVALFAGVAICHGINGFVSAVFSSELLCNLQTRFFDKTAQLPLNYFQQSSAGEFFTRFNHDVGQTQSLIANVLPCFIREAITAIVLAGVLLWFCPWQLVAVGSLIIALSVTLAIKCHRILNRYAIQQREGWGKINQQFDETVRGIDTIKTFGAEDQCKQSFQKKTANIRNLTASAGKITALFSPVIDLATRLGGLILVVLAFYLIGKNQLGIQTFLLFFFCSALLQGSITAMVNLYTEMPKLLVGIRNLSAFFSEQEETSAIESGSQQKAFARIDESMPINFDRLYFSYPSSKELYGGESLHIPSNEITLVRGPNGSGKSTLINLLLRFNSPDKGQICIGGIPLTEFDPRELRHKIAVVTQYHHIFRGTLRENLAIANSAATNDEMLSALDSVGLSHLINRDALGLDQILDSSGKVLSGGERQLICIARILLRRSPILILDEPWSNIDIMAARTLTKLLEKLRQNCTVVIIAHEKFEVGSVKNRISLETVESGMDAFTKLGSSIKSKDIVNDRTDAMADYIEPGTLLAGKRQ